MPHKEIAEYCENVQVLPLNEQIWAESIKQISKLSDEELGVVTEKIKESVQKQFSLDKMHEQYNVIYQKLV
jgi:hypothetical protein